MSRPRSFGHIDEYFPQAPAETYTGRWNTQTADYKDGDRRQLRLYLAGPDGQALIQTFFRINARLAGTNQPWIGICDLTNDMVAASAPLVVRLASPKRETDLQA